MLLLDKKREEKLIALAKTCFDPLPSEAEEKVLRDSASSASRDMPTAEDNRPDIRPDFVRWLATDPEAATHIDPKGILALNITLQDKLDLQNCRVLVPMHFQHCTIKNEVNLRSAETKSIQFLDSSFNEIIRADRINVDGPLFLRGSSFSKEIRLVGAKIDGSLDCMGAKLRAKGNALCADRAEIGGFLYLGQGNDLNGNPQIFESEGTIRLAGAKIKGDLSCTGAKLKVENGDALFADNIEILGNAYLYRGFESKGKIRLPAAQIKGALSFSGAKLTATEIDVLYADYVVVGLNVSLDKGFEASGTIRLLGAQIGGQLEIIKARISGVACKDMRLNGDMLWMDIQEPKEAILDLTGASVKTLRDNRESWPLPEHLFLGGFAYDELILHNLSSVEQARNNHYGDELPFEADKRIEWLLLQPQDRRINPQPWMQLSGILKAKGNNKGAKHVIFKYRTLLAKKKEFHPLRWLLQLLFHLSAFRCAWPYLRHPNRSWAIAFAWLEEAPIRICWPIAFTLMVGTLIFAGAFRSEAMIATVQIQPNTVLPNGESKNLSSHYPLSQPFLYTLENAVPLVRLGMDEKWVPDPKHKPRPWFPQFSWLNWLGWFNSYWVLVTSRVLLIFLGWFQAGVLGAALLKRFKE